jgi:hypothetical protein
MPEGHELASQLNAALLGLRHDFGREAEMILLLLRIRGLDRVGDHGLRRGLRDQLLEPGPRAEPLVHRGSVERPLGQLLVVGEDVFPGGLGEGGGRRGQCRGGHESSLRKEGEQLAAGI